MMLSLSNAQGVLHLISSIFQGAKEEGQFSAPDWIIYQAAYGAMLFVDEVIENLERLLHVLDALDSDADLEYVGDDEPSLGDPERQAGPQKGVGTLADDREEECEDEGAQCDNECQYDCRFWGGAPAEMPGF
jgi:hypothetical protein